MDADDAEALAAALGAPVGDVDGRRLPPMLCASDDTRGAVLGSRDHLFELKLDGVRIVADKRGGEVSLAYRSLRDATRVYPEIATTVAGLAPARLVLDGEIVAFDETGRPDFHRLCRRIQARGARGVEKAAREVSVAFLVFDVLAVGTRDVRRLPLEARRELLARIAPRDREEGSAIFVPPTFDDGLAVHRMCLERDLEGVVAKRRGSTYRSGERTGDWTKVKNVRDADLVVVAWSEGEGRRARLGALDLAAYVDGALVACGSVGSGLDEDTIDVLLARLRSLEVPGPTARKLAPARGRRFVRPELVVSVRYMNVSADGRLRAPVWRGLRPDVRIEDCVLDGLVRDTTVAVTVGAGASAKDARAEAEARYAGAPLVVLRVEGGRPGAVLAAARELHALASEIRLAAVALASGPSTIDVVLGTGGAALEPCRALAALLARMVASEGARVVVLARPTVPWSAGAGRVAMPVAWDELEAWIETGGRSESARERLETGRDPARELLRASVDLPAATRALEAIVARWASGERAR